MLWYGINRSNKFNNIYNKKHKFNYKYKNFNLNLKTSLFVNYNNLVIILPNSWKMILLKNSDKSKNIIYMYNNIYFFQFSSPLTKYFLSFDYNSSSLKFCTIYTNNFYKLYWNTLIDIFNSFNRPFFLKIGFRGKGYYIFKNKRQTITPQFGHAHRLYLYSYFASVRFLTKTSIFIFGLLKSDLVKIGQGIKIMRPIIYLLVGELDLKNK
jgi:hypothetical protein